MDKPPYIRLNLSSDHSDRCLNFKKIVALIKKQIEDQQDLIGCRLPPVRVLAHQLGISKNTIQNAYDELKSQGLIESKSRSGIYVSKRNSAIEVECIMHVPKLKIKKLNSTSHHKIEHRDIIPLSTVMIDPQILPNEKMTACFRSVLKNQGFPEFHDIQGMPSLREKIAARLRNRGMRVEAEHIIITNGSQQALDLVSRALSNKVIGTENPAYHLGKSLLELNGIKTIGLPVDPFKGFDEEAWKSLLEEHRPSMLYVTTNFQNPNGYSYTSYEIAKIIHWSKEYGFSILEDDWGSDMLSYSEFKPTMRALGGKNVLYMNSFTKKLFPSLRIGYIVANEDSVNFLLMAKEVSTIGVPKIIELALLEFLNRGYYDTHLKNLQKELDIRYKNCLHLLRKLMPDEVQWTTPGGGSVLWIELPPKINLSKLSNHMAKQGIGLQTSNHGFFGNPHSHGFKLGYAFLAPAKLEIALGKLSVEIKKSLM